MIVTVGDALDYMAGVCSQPDQPNPKKLSLAKHILFCSMNPDDYFLASGYINIEKFGFTTQERSKIIRMISLKPNNACGFLLMTENPSLNIEITDKERKKLVKSVLSNEERASIFLSLSAREDELLDTLNAIKSDSLYIEMAVENWLEKKEFDKIKKMIKVILDNNIVHYIPFLYRIKRNSIIADLITSEEKERMEHLKVACTLININ